jgi:hypothetical protein
MSNDPNYRDCGVDMCSTCRHFGVSTRGPVCLHPKRRRAIVAEGTMNVPPTNPGGVCDWFELAPTFPKRTAACDIRRVKMPTGGAVEDG